MSRVNSISINRAEVPNMRAGLMTSEEVEELLQDVPGFAAGQREREAILLLGEKLRELRKAYLCISQEEAATLIGIKQPDLSRIETGMGKRGPSFGTIARIADAYQGYLRQTDPTIHIGLNICISHDDASDTVLIPLTVN